MYAITTLATGNLDEAETSKSPYLSNLRAEQTLYHEQQLQIEKIRRGDKAAFDALFLEFYKKLHAYALTILKDHDLAEEAVQNVFYRIWERKNQLKPDGYLKSFLYRAVHNECLNTLKHQKVRAKFQDQQAIGSQPAGSLDNELHAAELQRQLFLAMGALPEKCREIFRLSRLEQLRYQEIADMLNISVKTVENQMGKALRILRIELADFLPLIFALLFERL